jgi:hypothetical protein
MYYEGLGALQAVDHIPAQNKAGSDLAAVVSQAATARNSGNLDQSTAQTLANRAYQIADSFAAFARSLGNSRADAGAAEIERLGHQIGNDILKGVQLPAPAMPPQQLTYAPEYTEQVPVGIVPAIQRTVQTVIRDARQGAADIIGGPEYVEARAPSLFPSWMLPAAAGLVGLYFFTKKR